MHYFSVGAVFREEAVYLPEWIEYHQLVGAEHFFLICNDDDVRLAESVLQPYLHAGVVTLWHEPGPDFRQGKMFTTLCQRTREETAWLACIDIDEFLFPVTAGAVPAILQQFEDYVGLAVHWYIFGSSGLHTKPPAQLDHFLWRERVRDARVRLTKSIVRPGCVERWKNVHLPLFVNGQLRVDETGAPLATERGPMSADLIRLNHYAVRSHEEFREKLSRWRGRAPRHEEKLFSAKFLKGHDRNDVYDDSLVRRFGPALRERLAARDLARQTPAS